MIGDNLYIHVELNDLIDINIIQERIILILEGLINKGKGQVKANLNNDFSYDQIIIDFKNDYGVPARFFIGYNNKNDSKTESISLSGFNHPAGEFLFDFGKLFLSKISKENFVKTVILTNDSKYNSLEILEKTNYHLKELGVISIVKN